MRTVPPSEVLRRAIMASEMTPCAIARAAGVAPEQVYRFVSGERDIRMDTADKLSETLGLELRARQQKTNKKGEEKHG